jgi:predicted transcriptional regulator
LSNGKFLFNQIAEVRCLLNGKTTDGRPAKKFNFTTTKYAIILLAATAIEIFRAETLLIQNSSFFNLYNLEKVAEYLHLEYDRRRQAIKMYEDLEDRGDVRKEVTADNKTYISLTEKGKKSCIRKLEELHSLKDYLSKIASEDQYADDEDKSTGHLRSKSQGLTDTELKIEELIAHISGWD